MPGFGSQLCSSAENPRRVGGVQRPPAAELRLPVCGILESLSGRDGQDLERDFSDSYILVSCLVVAAKQARITNY